VSELRGFELLVRCFLMMKWKPVQVQDYEKDEDKDKD
jgi:hypothetical protein